MDEHSERPSDKFRQALGEIIERRDLTQGQIEYRSGVSQQHISKVLRGKGSPGLDVAAAIARALYVSLDEICGLPRRDPSALTGEEAELLAMFRRTDDRGRRLLLGLAKTQVGDPESG